METTAVFVKKTKEDLKSYPVLRRRVEETLLRGQQRIEAAKLQSYWHTGASINEHVRLNGARAEYGKQVTLKLSEDIKIHDSVLRRLAEFAAKIPEKLIRAARHKSGPNPHQIEKKLKGKPLFWTHFRILITLEDDRTRYQLAEKAERGGWSTDRLADEVWSIKTRKRLPEQGKGRGEKFLAPHLGRLNTWRLTAPLQIHWSATSGLMFDHGFKSYTWLAPEEVKGFRAGEIVEVRHGRLVKSKRSVKDLFTYLAYVDKIIDADTLWVALDTGWKGVSRQKLRLRGIDAPEIHTAAGRRAYEFLKSRIARAPFLIVRSSKNDKYDRYETDLFIPMEGADTRHPAALELPQLIFVNNLLLERGFAVRMEE